jgi:single-stranded-DNA-specific exonuclease
VRWQILPNDPAAEGLVGALGCHPLVAQILWKRGLRDPADAAAFLEARLKDLPDPSSLAGVDAAVRRLARALAEDEPITVFGDYDVDGVSSTALLVSFLRACGGRRVDFHIPHRLRDGYGLGAEAVEELAARGTRLLVTLDCGVTAVSEIDAAAARGMEVIVVDHHQTPPDLPRAVAILNPWQPGCRYPTKELAAVGVTFLLCAALRRFLREQGWFERRKEPDLREFLDLVALGTIADVVPLLGANRLLVRAGLRRLGTAERPGIRALKRAAGMEADAEVGAGQVAFRLAPRINAAGRLDDARRAVELLLTEDAGRAESLARQLDAANAERQSIERALLEEAVAQAEGQRSKALVVAGEGWHPGVIGIVASRLVDRFRRPAVVIGFDPETGVGRGSGRSIGGFDLHAALARCADLLQGYGGHKQAAGLTIAREAVPAFAQSFARVAEEGFDEAAAEPVCVVEGVVRPGDLDESLCEAIEGMAPFGAGNPEPVLALLGAAVRGRVVGAGGDHLKLQLDEAPLVDAIGFGMGEKLAQLARHVDLAFTLAMDEFRGVRRPQLRLRAIRT